MTGVKIVKIVQAGGDHSLKVSRDPQAQAAIYDDVQRTIVRWMQSVIER